MKRFAYLLPLCLCACGEIELTDAPATDDPADVEQVTDEYTKKFTFTVKADFQEPARGACNEGGTVSVGVSYDRMTTGEAESQRLSRANAYMTADDNEMTDLWVIDCKDGAVVQSLHQSKDDEDWGAPSMSLTLGTHHVYFLASRGTGANYDDGLVTWLKPLDTFYKDYEVTVVKTSNGNRAVTLDRCATKATVYVDDAIPSGTTSMTLAPTVWYNGINMLTGEPVAAPSGYNVVFSVPEAYAGVSGVNYSIWSLAGAEEWTTDIAIVSKAGNAANANAVIKGAPMKANRVTVYHGRLYSESGSMGVSLNGEWIQSYEGTY